MDDSSPAPPVRGDEAELFRTYNDDLMRKVGGAVFTTPEIVEDACALAWARFLQHQPDRDQNWQGWLFRVAQREAWRMNLRSRDTAELRYDPDGELFDRAPRISDPADLLEGKMELREAMELVSELPVRLQRVAVLRALGLFHHEIGEMTGDSKARVAQLVSDANLRMSEAAADRQRRLEPAPRRVERLHELEEHPPAWLQAAIGKPPIRRTRKLGAATQLKAWRRAAIALDDYREAGANPIRDLPSRGPRPTEPRMRRLHDVAARVLDDLDAARRRECGRSVSM